MTPMETEIEEQEQTTEETGQEEQVTTPADDTSYTRDKQELDQERANARRAREELASVTELYETAEQRADELENQLKELRSSYETDKAALEAKKEAEEDILEEMDPDMIDDKVIKNIRAIDRKLKSQSERFQKERGELLKRLKDSSDKIAELEAERAEAKRKTEHDKAVESVLNRVEASLKRQKVTTPGQYRTEAMKLADEMVDNGQRKRPQSILEGIDLMEECYLQVIAKHQKKKGVSVDAGKSGVTSGVKTKPERKTGSLDEVADDMLKDKSWKED